MCTRTYVRVSVCSVGEQMARFCVLTNDIAFVHAQLSTKMATSKEAQWTDYRMEWFPVVGGRLVPPHAHDNRRRALT